jgi:hypothetical protein
VDSAGSQVGQVAGFCEHDDEFSGSGAMELVMFGLMLQLRVAA